MRSVLYMRPGRRLFSRRFNEGDYSRWTQRAARASAVGFLLILLLTTGSGVVAYVKRKPECRRYDAVTRVGIAEVERGEFKLCKKEKRHG